ncbi:hypothetical protein Plhal304r1_c086g0169111 [Plasmopara halstedii]
MHIIMMQNNISFINNMRVYIFVAIFVTGSSFCFAIALKAKPYSDLDTNDRVSLVTSPHEAYAISSNAHYYNVAHADNEVHVNNKANEERMPEGAIDDLLLSVSGKRPHLSDHAAHELQHAIDEVVPTKKFRFDLNLPLESAFYDALRNELYNGILADKTDLEIIDEPLKTWLRSARDYCDVMNVGDNPTGIKMMLDLLVGKLSAPIQKSLPQTLNHQPDPHRQVVKLFDKIRADQEFKSFAEDVQRMMVLDSTYKTLVFEEWTQNLYLPDNMLPNFDNTISERSLKNPLFLAWLNYVDWYWTFAKDQRLDRCNTYIINAFPQNVGHVKALKYAWRFDKWIKTQNFADDNSNRIQHELHRKLFTKNGELTWILHYINADKKNFAHFILLKLLRFLISLVEFDELVKLLISLYEDSELMKLVRNMLIAMFSSDIMLQDLVEANVTAERYKHYLLIIADLFALSDRSIDVNSQFKIYAAMFDRQKKKLQASQKRVHF